jgi:sporulation protein YlmC with PRC-barrel domain
LTPIYWRANKMGYVSDIRILMKETDFDNLVVKMQDLSKAKKRAT